MTVTITIAIFYYKHCSIEKKNTYPWSHLDTGHWAHAHHRKAMSPSWTRGRMTNEKVFSVILSWRHPGVISLGHPGVILWSSLGHPWVILGSSWGHPGSQSVILGSSWGHPKGKVRKGQKRSGKVRLGLGRSEKVMEGLILTLDV